MPNFKLKKCVFVFDQGMVVFTDPNPSDQSAAKYERYKYTVSDGAGKIIGKGGIRGRQAANKTYAEYLLKEALADQAKLLQEQILKS